MPESMKVSAVYNSSGSIVFFLSLACFAFFPLTDLLQDTIETERHRIVAAFKNIRQFLEDKEKNLLAEMEEVGQEIATRRDDSIAKILKELSSLEHTIAELKEKCGKPSGDLLEVRW